MDFILDNLIAAGKAKPMIIVMDNLNAVKPGEDGIDIRGLADCPRRRPHQRRGGERLPPAEAVGWPISRERPSRR